MGNVNHEDKYLGSLNVPQKLQAKAFVIVCILDDTWNICNGHPVIIDKFYMADRGLESREFIVGYFGKGSGRCCQKRRFTYIWEANQSNICESFKFEIDNLGLTLLAEFLLFFHVWVQFVAFTCLSSLSQHYTLLVCTQIKNKLFALLLLVEFDLID